MIYETFGPFDLLRDGGKVTKAALKEFWAEREGDSPESLCDAVGVYILAVQAKSSGPVKPWYVGRTDRQSFKKRLSQQDTHFRQVLDEATNGKLKVFLIACKTPTKKGFKKPTKTKITANNSLESLMIGSALNQNKRLVNANKIKQYSVLHVPGYMNNGKGRLRSAAAALKKTLGAS